MYLRALPELASSLVGKAIGRDMLLYHIYICISAPFVSSHEPLAFSALSPRPPRLEKRRQMAAQRCIRENSREMNDIVRISSDGHQLVAAVKRNEVDRVVKTLRTRRWRFSPAH